MPSRPRREMIARYFKSLVFAALTIAALYLLLFTSHAPAIPQHRTVIEYWEKWTGAEAAQMQQIVDDFNASVGAQKHIWVRYLSMSNINQKTLVATAAGVPPDVAGLWDQQVAQFAARDALEPLDDLAAAHGITAANYKPVYWNGCRYAGRLFALVSTPATCALHYNRRVFWQNASRLRAAGLDPSRAPRTLQELDRYAAALDIFSDPQRRHIVRCGYLPVEPGWFLNSTIYWFGGSLFDPATNRFTFDTTPNLAAYRWIQTYALKLGADASAEFKSGLGGFNSTQNPFLLGRVTMVLQGPWMANFIYHLRPSMSEALVPWSLEPYLPRVLRPYNYEWAVAPFPSAVPGLDDVTQAGYDVLVIPRGAKHKQQAFEFIAYINRQDVMEKLCSLHCKNSPLARVSDRFIRTHPNPYIDVFERLAASPNAHDFPSVAVWPEANDELNVLAQRIWLLKKSPADALAESQNVIEEKYQRYLARAFSREAQPSAP